ncbi:putative toxin-antitoxin system toxin component, PIN family [Pseudomonadota bacterium]
MIKTVIDCNVIISAGLNDGNCRNLIFKVIQNHKNYISKEIVDEYVEVISRKKFKKYYKYMLELITIIVEASTIIDIADYKSKKTQLPDKKDEMYLVTAVKSKTNYIITGNIKHFPERKYNKVEVITPKEFLEIINKQTS